MAKFLYRFLSSLMVPIAAIYFAADINNIVGVAGTDNFLLITLLITLIVTIISYRIKSSDFNKMEKYSLIIIF